MKHKARQIAVRAFLSNVDGQEDDAYEYLTECPRPDETYADDYLNYKTKQYGIWQPFEMYPVSEVVNLIDNLTDDIVMTFTDKPEPSDETMDDE